MSLLGAIGELERVYGELSDLFPTPMPRPVITIQTRGRKNARAWFCADRWNDEYEKRTKAEFNICAEYLADGALGIAHSLLHEMVHQSNNVDGIRDCSSNQYHNKRFAERCQIVGLIAKNGYRGWSDTEI